jgi:peptidyl-prolyl cis-trans isomerase D
VYKRQPLGWYVVKVMKTGGTPAKSLAEAKPEIVAALTKEKGDNALSDLSSKIEGAIADGASFDEVVKNNKLTLVTTPPLLSTGRAPSNAAWVAPRELAALLKSGFEADAEDDPTVEQVIPNQQYALLGVAKVIAPVPLPVATVKPLVVRDIVIDRTGKRAQQIAVAIRDKVRKGVPIDRAMAEAGVKLPPVQPAVARQIDLTRLQPEQIPPPVRALFRLRVGKVDVMPDPQGRALFVVTLDRIEPGDMAVIPGLVGQTRNELASAQASELADQFINAVQQEIGVTRDQSAIAQAKKRFVGGQ